MKKIAVILAAVLIGVTCMAQRPGSPNRGGASYSRPSAPSASPRGGSYRSTPSISRGGSSYSSRPSTTTYSRPSSSPTRSYNYSRPATRSVAPTTHRPAPTSNAVRRGNGNVYRGYSNSRPQPAPSVNRGDRVYHRPGQYTPNPPAHRPVPHGMHPLPPRFHPVHHHHMINLHYRPYTGWFVPNIYWMGYWSYVHTYPYDQVVVYVQNERPTIEIVAICTDDDYVYTIYKDNASGNTYLSITNNADNVLAKIEINRHYNHMQVDNDGGVWLLRKNDKKPMYVLYRDNNLYCYEED